MADRWVTLERSFNFRDLGGWPTADGRTIRWRRVFRSDTLHRLTDTDLTTIADLGLRTVIDLRTAHELEAHGSYVVHGHEVAFHHLPLVPSLLEPLGWDFPEGAEGMGRVYVARANAGERALAAALEVLAAPDAHPAVFHCTAGKDRTGILAAVLLGLLGVPVETIIEDYVLTQLAKPRADAFYKEIEASDSPRSVIDVSAYPSDVADARAESITTFLELVDERGGFDEYAAAIGVQPRTIEQLRAALLE
jgi:protein-tyrosine phosphatase